jgi:hypothetical protein
VTRDEQDLESLAHAFLAAGGEELARNFERYEQTLRTLLALPPVARPQRGLYLRCLQHIEAYASWRWDPRMAALREPCSRALEAWCAEPDEDLDILCALLDLCYFLTWCFRESNIEQSREMLPDTWRLARRTGSAITGKLKRRDGVLKVGYLTRIADPASAITVCTRHVVEALASRPERFRPCVYVMERMESNFPKWLSGGALLRSFLLTSKRQLIERFEALVAAEGLDILLSDMNNGLATVLFARRQAPLQGLVQLGLPSWAALNLDFVFNGFGIDPVTAGWGDARVYDFLPPWDLEGLRGAPSPTEVAELRASLAPARLVIGCYARLIKFTPGFLRAAERVLIADPGTALLLGGTGDAAAVEGFIAQSPVGDRIALHRGFVNGRVWALALDVFLDTWPFQGGGSVREVLVRGVPVVSIRSAEMPAMSLEKDPALIAADWDGFVDLTLRLVQDAAFREEARVRATEIAATMADRERFQGAFIADLERSIAQCGAQ